jgi:hypothetical protein
MPVIPPEELVGTRVREGTYMKDTRAYCIAHNRRTDKCAECKLSGSFCACGKRKDRCCCPGAPKRKRSEAEEKQCTSRPPPSERLCEGCGVRVDRCQCDSAQTTIP